MSLKDAPERGKRGVRGVGGLALDLTKKPIGTRLTISWQAKLNTAGKSKVTAASRQNHEKKKVKFLSNKGGKKQEQARQMPLRVGEGLFSKIMRFPGL